jgi:TetR/AcrR family transcriptional regulator, cholesterol catabolism regulator
VPAEEASPRTTRSKRANAAAGERRVRGTRRRDQEVLDAAAKVFHTRGYADASVQHIADELGILKGSLYHYIDSKEDLLFRLLDETHREVETILDEVRAIPDVGPLERLKEYTRRQVEYTSRNLAKMGIYYRDADQLSDQRRRELTRKRRVHEQFVTGLIEEAQERGEADRSLDPTLATNCLFGSMIWVYRWYKPGGKMRSADVAETCAEFVLRGVVGSAPAAG